MLSILMMVLFQEASPPTNGVYIDFSNMQPWQWVGGVLLFLGISPAPWITALATGRLLFRADLDSRLKVAQENYEKALTEERRFREALSEAVEARYAVSQDALSTERGRNEKLTDALEDSTKALEVMNGALLEFNKVAKKATE